jgi:deazaflavin-dependent oxidoreductase (nitroreductase family)
VEDPFCYLTTTGRVTGGPHTIEIWFAARGGTIYLLSGAGDRSDWVRNLRARPEVGVRIGRSERTGVARLVTDPDEDRVARDLVHDKYAGSYAGDLTSWRRTAMPVAIDLDGSGVGFDREG